jgi:adenosylcobinamide-phosphate synthase
MATFTGLALGGPRVYRDDVSDEPFMNAGGRENDGPGDVDVALGVFWRAMTVLGMVVGVLAVLAG